MINHEIKSDVVNVVTESGLTKMTLEDAIALAGETGEDVVVVNNSSEIPVVKIVEYNKYLYDKKKKEKDMKKKNRMSSQDTKEVRLSDSIAEHDIMVKAKNIDRILKDGDKVKITIRYKGRLIRNIDGGPKKMIYLTEKLEQKFKIEKEPKIESNIVSMVISPEK